MLLAAALAASACTSGSAPTAPSSSPRFGTADAPAVSVAGTWSGTATPRVGTPSTWTLVLTQRGDRLEGQLTTAATRDGVTTTGSYRLVSGSKVDGRTAYVYFDKSSEFEKPLFQATLSADGATLSGPYSVARTTGVLTRR